MKEDLGTQELLDNIGKLEDDLSKIITQNSLDSNNEVPLMISCAAGTIAAMHLIYSDLKPDDKVMAILVRGFEASFRRVAETVGDLKKINIRH